MATDATNLQNLCQKMVFNTEAECIFESDTSLVKLWILACWNKSITYFCIQNYVAFSDQENPCLFPPRFSYYL